MIKATRFSKEFRNEMKRLSKKYRSLPDDFWKLYQSILENPEQGVSLPDHMRKIRLAISSKGKGKSGGARVIIRYVVTENVLNFLFLYDKSEISNVSTSFLADIWQKLSN